MDLLSLKKDNIAYSNVKLSFVKHMITLKPFIPIGFAMLLRKTKGTNI